MIVGTAQSNHCSWHCWARGVRYYPNSGHVRCTSPCPLSANSGHRLFDHLVSAANQRLWDLEAESLRCLEVYDQLDLGRLHNR